MQDLTSRWCVSFKECHTLRVADCKVSLKQRGQNASSVTSRKVNPERLLSVTAEHHLADLPFMQWNRAPFLPAGVMAESP